METIFIATSSFAKESQKPIQIIKEAKYNIKTNPFGRKLTKEELEICAINSKGIIAGTENYDFKSINKLKNLKVISRLGSGMDNIDSKIITDTNIKVLKTFTTPAPAVAELTLGLIINVARNISKNHHKIMNGIWEKEMGFLAQGKTLGIIGLGIIGKTLVELVRGFNFNILAFDLNEDQRFKNEHDITYCDIETLMKKSDIITLHLNLSNDTKNFINKEKLKLMKPSAIIINASRGEIIDEEALYNSLIGNELFGAGIDVFHNEPYQGKLAELDNVVLTPHIGSYAKETRIEMEIEASKNLIRGLNEIK